MTIWVDADSLPRDIRHILIRRDNRDSAPGARETRLCFVSARKLPDIPPAMTVIVAQGEDAADNHIASRAEAEDIVITRDIPFAERMALRGIAVLNDRGEIYTKENVSERRSLRDAAQELRFLGLAPPSPKGSGRGERDKKRFADALDRLLAGSKTKKLL